MIWNYLRSAIRNLLRQRAYAGVNIAGLAIGMASSLTLLFWVLDEISYDRFHDNADRECAGQESGTASCSRTGCRRRGPKLCITR